MLDFDSLANINLGHKSGIENYFVEKGDLFFVRSYGTWKGVGYVCMAPRSDDGTVHGGFIIRFRVNNQKVNPLYLTYLLRTEEYRQTITTTSGGSNINNVNQEVLGRLIINLPSYEEQRTISETLWKFDNLIENNRRRVQLIEDMARTLYREWFVHFRFPGHEDVDIVNSEIGEIPDGWKLENLSSVAQVNDRSIKAGMKPDVIQYVDISAVSTSQISNTREILFKEAPSRAKRLVKHGDTIWSTVRPNRKAYSLILDPPQNMVVSTGFAVLTPLRVPYTYLYQSTTTDEFADYLTNRATGAAYPAVNQGDFKKAILLIPTTQLLESFHQIIEPLYTCRQSIFNMNKILGKVRNILLPKLVSGKIGVSDLKIEIPPDTHKTSKSSDQSTLDQRVDGSNEEK